MNWTKTSEDHWVGEIVPTKSEKAGEWGYRPHVYTTCWFEGKPFQGSAYKTRNEKHYGPIQTGEHFATLEEAQKFAEAAAIRKAAAGIKATERAFAKRAVKEG